MECRGMKEGIAEFDEAIQLNRSYADAFNRRGLSYGKKGDLDKAIADFTEASGLNQNTAKPIIIEAGFTSRKAIATRATMTLHGQRRSGTRNDGRPGGDDPQRGQQQRHARHAREIQQLRRADRRHRALGRLPLRLRGCLGPLAGEYEAGAVPYDPSTGQRLRQNLIGFASGTTNLTAWCGNDPTGLTDPTGEDAYPGLAGSGSRALMRTSHIIWGTRGFRRRFNKTVPSAFPTRYRDKAAPR